MLFVNGITVGELCHLVKGITEGLLCDLLNGITEASYAI